MPWNGLPLINTIVLLTSSVTLHFAHVSLERQALGHHTVARDHHTFGMGFLALQAEEYMHAYHEMGLT